MLTVRIIAVGKAKGAWVKDSQTHFAKLLKKYCKLEVVEIAETSVSPDGSIDSRKVEEAQKLRKRLSDGYHICLDQHGKQYSSEAFAEKLSHLMRDGQSVIEFIIGGAYGLDTGLLAECDLQVSLSSFTLSHQIARVALLEQLFRCFSINANTQYHK